jgi:cation diffusion facilitator CzcD-associated flavoprotein CzcO
VSFFGIQYLPESITPEVASHPGIKTRRYAIVGAGAAGLCAIKYLKQAGAEHIDCFEIGTKIGGLWCYNNDNGLSSAYRTLHINTARTFTRFSHMDLPKDVQAFPHHTDMYQYFLDYAEKFNLVQHVRFKSKVVGISHAPDHTAVSPKWLVEVEGRQPETYDAVIVCTGHLSRPRDLPEFTRFGGEYLHVHHYREPEGFAGKRVCVIGGANSAFDVSADICVIAKKTVMVARSGVIISPKTVSGIPYGDIMLHLNRRCVPNWVRRRAGLFITWLMHGDMTKLGFKKQTRWQHTTSNGTLVSHIQYRRVTVKQGIERIEGKRIFFVDGTSEEFDSLVAATGYDLEFPFIAKELVPTKDSYVELYKRIVRPGQNGLYFLGYVNTTVALNIMFEHQMKWILRVDSGKSQLPPEAEMWNDIAAKRAWIVERYGDSERYSMEEPHLVYFPELERSSREGETRNRQRGSRSGHRRAAVDAFGGD